MPLGFYIIMAAQFFSALADNALLVAAIALLRDMHAAPQTEPLLKLVFALSYVLLAAFVGAFADSMSKARVMLISNSIKIFGCLLLLFGLSHPLFAYAVIGLGAAAYSPAKYGILTEYLPHRLLVVANGWIEGLTVGAIIAGVVLGGAMIAPDTVAWLNSLSWPMPHEFSAVIGLIGLLYVIAALFNLYIPNTGVVNKPLKSNPLYLMRDFYHCLKLLWRDPLGQIALAVTTLFWGAGATLQFIIINWASTALAFDLSKASMLQGVVALGVAIGAVMAAWRISLLKAVAVIPLGIAMGFGVILLVWVSNLAGALILMVLVGFCAGFFVVPMNALLQHRGHILMGAGHSIAVQNFNENISILAMTGGYALLLMLDVAINTVIILFGLFIAISMLLVWWQHSRNQRRHNALLSLRHHS